MGDGIENPWKFNLGIIKNYRWIYKKIMEKFMGNLKTKFIKYSWKIKKTEKIKNSWKSSFQIVKSPSTNWWDCSYINCIKKLTNLQFNLSTIFFCYFPFFLLFNFLLIKFESKFRIFTFHSIFIYLLSKIIK